jgi:hypothetical protein
MDTRGTWVPFPTQFSCFGNWPEEFWAWTVSGPGCVLIVSLYYSFGKVKSERLQQYFTISELNTLHTATIEYGSYGLYVNGWIFFQIIILKIFN